MIYNAAMDAVSHTNNIVHAHPAERGSIRAMMRMVTGCYFTFRLLAFSDVVTSSGVFGGTR